MEILLFFWDLLGETGLVVTPFLPGDSLLFVAGTLWAAAALNVHALAALLIFAAIAGNTTNYWIGRYIGPKVFQWKDSRWFNRKALDKTHEFYERHGGKTIVITRFVPIIRTFAPFVAGVGSMTHARFQMFNVAGGVLWVASLLYAGFFFGNIPFIRNNLTLVIFGIIGLSVAPVVLEFLRHRLRRA
ncbi:MAG: VTT domain-containing protein [Proteobacteria bacterium]|nr:VTT domain-containing protein [Pseudomonadota bacterium]